MYKSENVFISNLPRQITGSQNIKLLDVRE